MKMQPFDSKISLTFELISDLLDAAKELSVLGQMLLLMIWPVTDFSFVTSMIWDRFAVISSVGNLVAVSLVPTWMIISEWAELTCKQLLSVDTTSLIVESPMIRHGKLAWALAWAGWTGLISLSDWIWADNSALLYYKLFISPLDLEFSFDKLSSSPHSLLTESVSVVRVCRMRRHEAHTATNLS